MRQWCVGVPLVAVTLLAGGPVGASSDSACQDWGVIRYAHTTINIRQAPSTDASIVGQLQAGQSVRADFLRGEWYAVFALAQTVRDEAKALGYIYAPLLKAAPPARTQTRTRACCKICRRGKACGNSCIARNKTCHQPPGCACNG